MLFFDFAGIASLDTCFPIAYIYDLMALACAARARTIATAYLLCVCDHIGFMVLWVLIAICGRDRARLVHKYTQDDSIRVAF